MTSKKITELSAVTSLVDTDLFPVVQDVPTVPVTKKTSFLKIKEALLSYFNYYYTQINGWIPAVVPWTYASSTTFTVSGDVTQLFPKGTKIKLIQTTTKYFYVVKAEYASPNTTVTITGGSDYVLSNNPISSAWYSYAVTPQGFPAYFNYIPTWTTTGTQPVLGDGTLSGRFWIQGQWVGFQFYFMFGSTTSGGSGNWRFALPVNNNNTIASQIPVFLRDGGINSYPRFANLDQVSYIEGFVQLDSPNNNNTITATSPFTWGNGDYMRVGPGFYLME